MHGGTPCDEAKRKVAMYMSAECPKISAVFHFSEKDTLEVSAIDVGVTVVIGRKDEDEDVASMALTAVRRLCAKQNLGLEAVGMFQFASHDLLDRSKCIKTEIMALAGCSADNPTVTPSAAC